MDLKKISFLISILFCHLGYTQANIPTDKKIVTLEANYIDLINFHTQDIGIKANTLGGRIEVKLFSKHNYDYQGGIDNPNFVFGFYSDDKNTGLYDKSSWIVESYWPWWALGGNNPFVSDYGDAFVEINSTDQQWFRKMVIRAYNKQFAVWDTDGVYDLGDGTMEFVLEIEFDLPQPIDNYQYDIKLPGFDVLNDIDIDVMAISNSGYLHFYEIEPDFLHSLPSNFKELQYWGPGVTYLKKTGFLKSTEEFYAYYNNGQKISISVMQTDVEDVEQAETLALEAAINFGKIPLPLRKSTSRIVIANQLTVNGYTDLITTTIGIRNPLDLKGLLFFAIQLSYGHLVYTPLWGFAYDADVTGHGYPTLYEKNHPFSTSASQTIPFWLYYTYGDNSFPLVKNRIASRMPNLLAYYDNLFSNQDMSPLVNPLPPPPLTYERFQLTVQDFETNQLLDPIDIVVNAYNWETPILDVTQEYTLTILVNGLDYETITNLDNQSNLFQTTWGPTKPGINTISGYMTYADGFKSSIGMQTVNVEEPSVNIYNIINPITKSTIYNTDGDVPFTIMAEDGSAPSSNDEVFLTLANTGRLFNYTQGSNASEFLVSKNELFSVSRGEFVSISGFVMDQNDNISELNSIQLKTTLYNWEFFPNSDHVEVNQNEPFVLIVQSNAFANIDKDLIEQIQVETEDGQSIPSTYLENNFDNNLETLEVSLQLQLQSSEKLSVAILYDGQWDRTNFKTITVKNDGSNLPNQNKSAPNQDDKSSSSIELNQLIMDKVILDDILLYPNPSENGSFRIAFNLKNGSDIYYDIFDISGRLVYKSMDNYYENGINEVSFENKENQLSSGLYLVKLNVDGKSSVFKLVVE